MPFPARARPCDCCFVVSLQDRIYRSGIGIIRTRRRACVGATTGCHPGRIAAIEWAVDRAPNNRSLVTSAWSAPRRPTPSVPTPSPKTEAKRHSSGRQVRSSFLHPRHGARSMLTRPLLRIPSVLGPVASVSSADSGGVRAFQARAPLLCAQGGVSWRIKSPSDTLAPPRRRRSRRGTSHDEVPPRSRHGPRRRPGTREY